MRKPLSWGGAVLALVLSAFAPIAPAQAQPRAEEARATRGVPVQEIRSPSGIGAWLVSDSTVPIITLRAYWRGGSAMEPEMVTGVTSVMADMLTEGAGDLDANAFKERIEELNMGLGVSAGWDGISLSLTTLTENRDAAFEMARLALMAPRFDAAPLARIKRQLEVGVRARETNPSYIANLALDTALIGEHPYARRVDLEDIANINVDFLRAMRTASLTRRNLQITIVGDIDAQNAGRLIDSVFGALPAGDEVQPTLTEARMAPAQGVIVRELPQPQSLVLFVAPGVQDEDPDWLPLVVANYILGGGGFSSRLMDAVREERGLVYGISTSPSVRDYLAQIRGAAQTENDDVRAAIEATQAEIRRFYEEGPTQAEVDDAITYLTGSFALDLDSNQKIANVLQSYQVSGRPSAYVNRRNDLIAAVTREDVVRVTRRLFNPDAFTFVVVGQPAGMVAAP